MFFNKLGVVMITVLAIGASFANVSWAQVWKVAGTKLAPGEFREASATSTGTSVFASTVLGSPIKVTSTSISSKVGKIVQSGSGVSGVSTLVGYLVFGGNTIDEPASCKTTNPIETVTLLGTTVHGNTEATAENVYVKVVPREGEILATLKVTECAAAGSYPLKGSFYVLAQNKTGVEATRQVGITSGAITSSQGGGLTLGKQAATLEGTIDISLTSGSAFGLVKE